MTLYIFKKTDLVNPEPQYSDSLAGFESDEFSFKEGEGAYKITLKRQSGKVTSTANANGGGFTNTFTGVVAANMDQMSLLARTLNNSDEWGAMVGDGKGGYYVLFDPTFGISFSMESDTGDSPESDHGHTITIAVGPMLYPLAKWTGSLTVKDEDTVPGA